MRTGSPVLYGPDYRFEFGKGRTLRGSERDAAVIISSGRGVHEALTAAELCARENVAVRVVDMPSIDEGLLLELYDWAGRCFSPNRTMATSGRIS